MRSELVEHQVVDQISKFDTKTKRYVHKYILGDIYKISNCNETYILVIEDKEISKNKYRSLVDRDCKNLLSSDDFYNRTNYTRDEFNILESIDMELEKDLKEGTICLNLIPYSTKFHVEITIDLKNEIKKTYDSFIESGGFYLHEILDNFRNFKSIKEYQRTYRISKKDRQQ